MSDTELVVVASGAGETLEEIATIERHGFGDDGLSKFNLALLARTGGLVALKKGSRIVAHALLNICFDDGKRVFLFGIAVDSGCRGKGYGRELMTRIIGYLTESGWREIELTVSQSNPNALKLYLSLGFVETGRILPAADNSAERLVLVKKLVAG